MLRYGDQRDNRNSGYDGPSMNFERPIENVWKEPLWYATISPLVALGTLAAVAVAPEVYAFVREVAEIPGEMWNGIDFDLSQEPGN